MPSDERLGVNRDLTSLVQHPKVISGEWVSEYNYSNHWQPFEKFPEAYNPYYDLVRKMLDIRGMWEGESFHDTTTEYWTSFYIIMNSIGSPPQKIPWFSPPSIEVKKVLYEFLHRFVHHNDLLKYGRDPRLPYTLKEKYKFNFVLADPNLPPDPKRGEYNRLVQVLKEPFYFYQAGSLLKPVGNDPFRFKMMIFTDTIAQR